MFGILNFETFLLAGILLNITPGADTMYILGRSLTEGKKAGILSALGITAGGLFHVFFAALGLSIIIAKSALAFQIVKYVGAAYLIYLGIKSIVKKTEDNELQIAEVAKTTNHRKLFLSGMITNILNPKVALFFLAFIPQFINPEFTNSPVPFIVLGLTFLTTGAIWFLCLVSFTSRLANKLEGNTKFMTWVNKIAGSLFILLGIKLALSKK